MLLTLRAMTGHCKDFAKAGAAVLAVRVLSSSRCHGKNGPLFFYLLLKRHLLQLVWLRWKYGVERWPFAWQLRNLFIWLRVRYARQASRSFAALPALNAAQSLRFKAYCKLQGPIALSGPTKVARDMSLREGSHYVGDLLHCLHPRFLNQHFVKEFGDVSWIPDVPKFVKSRPISGDNGNGVLLPMDVRRHMFFPHDPFSFQSKKPVMVWRGASFQPHRQVFMRQISGLKTCDAGDPGLAPTHAHFRPWLSIYQQLRFKYIISIEGNDVATNLKWIMHSNSLCFMVKPKFETWFLESQLVAGVHYAEIADDFSNLQQVYDYYESHPEEALSIIRAAQAYTRQFLDSASERLLTQHVCQAYFAAVAPQANT